MTHEELENYIVREFQLLSDWKTKVETYQLKLSDRVEEMIAIQQEEASRSREIHNNKKNIAILNISVNLASGIASLGSDVGNNIITKQCFDKAKEIYEYWEKNFK